MKKRILSLILAVAMVLALFPAAAFADGAADPLPSEELSELIPEEAMGDATYVGGQFTFNNADGATVTIKNAQGTEVVKKTGNNFTVYNTDSLLLANTEYYFEVTVSGTTKVFKITMTSDPYKSYDSINFNDAGITPPYAITYPVTFSITPADVAVTVNGTVYNNGAQANLAAGTYTATADGYQSVSFIIESTTKTVTLTLEEEEDNGVIVGRTDNTTAYLGAFTDVWTVPVGYQAVVSFKNYSSKANNYNNFALVLDDDAAVVADQLAVLRADNWDNIADSNSNISSNFNWPTFKDDLHGASVVAKAVHTEGSVVIRADITTTSGATYYEEKTIATTSDSVYFAITVDNSHLTNVEGTVTVDSIATGSGTVGAASCTTAWAGAFSPAWLVPVNSKATMIFVNQNDQKQNWHNAAVVLQNAVNHSDDAVFRVDNYGWQGSNNTGTNGNPLGWSLDSNWDWSTIKSFTNGATVTLTVYNYGSTADVRMDFEKDGTNRHQYYNGITVNGDVFFRLTVENAYITYDAAPTISYLVSFTGGTAEATVTASGNAGSVVLDENGAGSLYLPAGNYTFTQSKTGYEDKTVSDVVSGAQSVTLTELEQSAVPNPKVTFNVTTANTTLFVDGVEVTLSDGSYTVNTKSENESYTWYAERDGYIKDGGKVVVGAEDASVEVALTHELATGHTSIGYYSNTTPWWAEKTDIWQVPNNTTVTRTFTMTRAGDYNQNGYFVVLQSSNTYGISTENTEYIVVRVDNWCDSRSVVFDQDTMSVQAGFVWGNDAAAESNRAFLNGADVALSITKNDTKIYVDAVYTKDGYEETHTQRYVIPDIEGDLYFYLTVENGRIEMVDDEQGEEESIILMSSFEANTRAILQNNNGVDPNGRGFITADEARQVKTLNIARYNGSGLNIRNLGIFTELESLTINNASTGTINASNGVFSFASLKKLKTLSITGALDNAYKALDLSHNTALTSVTLTNTGAASVNVNGAAGLETLNITDTTTALTEIDCVGTGLTGLDVSAYTALQRLDIGDCDFTELDVSHNTGLTFLSVANNTKLAALDLSQNTALATLFAWNCGLTTLDLSKNTSLDNINLGFAGNADFKPQSATKIVPDTTAATIKADVESLVGNTPVTLAVAEGVSIEGSVVTLTNGAKAFTYLYPTGHDNVTLPVTVTLEAGDVILLKQYSVEFAGKTVLHYDIDAVPESFNGKTVNFYKEGSNTPYYTDTLKTGDREIAMPILPRDLNATFYMQVADGDTRLPLFSVSGSDYTSGNGVPYSAAKYADAVAKGEYEDDEKALAANYALYGNAAAAYFDDTAGAPEEIALTVDQASALAAYTVRAQRKSNSGITNASVSVMFEADNSIRVYVTGESSVLDSGLKFRVYTDGNKETAELVNIKTRQNNDKTETYYYMQSPGIPAADLAQSYIFDLVTAEGTTILRVTASALSYANMLNAKYPETNNSDEAIKGRTLARSLYLFWEAAK